jgi:hypothetical protein
MPEAQARVVPRVQQELREWAPRVRTRLQVQTTLAR